MGAPLVLSSKAHSHEPPHHHHHHPHHPHRGRAPQHMEEWRIIMCALAMCGIQVCYAAQINMGTAELLLLGISERAVSLAWLAGPLSGLIVQPIVGHISDGCTSRLGRRRPFLLAGTVFTAAALLLFSNAARAAAVLRLPASSALPIAVASFFLLDFAIQAIQAPLRALVTDVVPKPQRALANAYIGVFTGLGNLVGGLLAAVRLSVLVPVFSSDVQALFAAAAAILVVTVLACVLVTPETPLEAAGYAALANYDSSPRRAAAGGRTRTTTLTTGAAGAGAGVTAPLLEGGADARAGAGAGAGSGSWRSVVAELRGIPRPFWQVFAVQLCTWCGFFTLFVYVNTWVGRNVYLGDGSAPAGSAARETFEKGVRLGGKGNAVTALVTLAYALALPGLLERFGTLRVYAASQAVEAGCLLCAPLLRGRPGQTAPSAGLRLATMADIGLFGVVWATTMGVPWTLIGDALESDGRYARKIGLYTTLFNASQSFPQLVVAFAAPGVLAAAGDDPAAVMFVGGVCAAAGGALVFALRVDEADEPAERRGDAAPYDGAFASRALSSADSWWSEE